MLEFWFMYLYLWGAIGCIIFTTKISGREVKTKKINSRLFLSVCGPIAWMVWGLMILTHKKKQ